MEQNKLFEILPKSKFDDANIQTIKNIGFPQLNCVIPELLFWISDMNWPIAKEICDILSKSGEEIIPGIRNILFEMDEERIWFLIDGLLPLLNKNLQKQLLPDILHYISIANEEYKEHTQKYLNLFMY